MRRTFPEARRQLESVGVSPAALLAHVSAERWRRLNEQGFCLRRRGRRWHSPAAQGQGADDLKDNYAKLARRLVLRFSSVLIYTDDPEAVQQIRCALDE